MKITKQQVSEVLQLSENCDPQCLSLSSGVFTYRKGYYWTPSVAPIEFFRKNLQKLSEKFDVTDVIYGDNYHPFRGGEGIKKNSHYWMKFKVKEKNVPCNENKTIDVA